MKLPSNGRKLQEGAQGTCPSSQPHSWATAPTLALFVNLVLHETHKMLLFKLHLVRCSVHCNLTFLGTSWLFCSKHPNWSKHNERKAKDSERNCTFTIKGDWKGTFIFIWTEMKAVKEKTCTPWKPAQVQNQRPPPLPFNLLTSWLFTGTWWVLWIEAKSHPPGLPNFLLNRFIVFPSGIFLGFLVKADSAIAFLQNSPPSFGFFESGPSTYSLSLY